MHLKKTSVSRKFGEDTTLVLGRADHSCTNTVITENIDLLFFFFFPGLELEQVLNYQLIFFLKD